MISAILWQKFKDVDLEKDEWIITALNSIKLDAEPDEIRTASSVSDDVLQNLWEEIKAATENSQTIPEEKTTNLKPILTVYGSSWIHSSWTGAPNENIVQNHLNIAFLNVF